MRVRMLVDRTGTDNGRSYPAPPGEIDVPDDLGASLCAAGWAQPVAQDEPVETRGEPETPAEAPAEDTPAKPAVNAPKADWVAHAVGQGAAPADAENMTKQALVEHYG